MDKITRALKYYNGHKGESTLAHVRRNVEKAYPAAYDENTARQYGLIMSVANISFQDGRAEASKHGAIWAYDKPTDWLAGIGPLVPASGGGHNNTAVVVVTDKTVTITNDKRETIAVYERKGLMAE